MGGGVAVERCCSPLASAAGATDLSVFDFRLALVLAGS